MNTKQLRQELVAKAKQLLEDGATLTDVFHRHRELRRRL